MIKFLTDHSLFNEFKIKFLKLSVVITIATQLFYLYRYIFLHVEYTYAYAILPFIGISFFSAFLIFVKQKYNAGSFTLLISGVLLLIFLLGTVGGFKAPGLQWVIMIPVICGLFYGKKGFPLGLLLFVIVNILFTFIEFPNFLLTTEHYFKEKLLTLFYSVLLFYFLSLVI